MIILNTKRAKQYIYLSTTQRVSLIINQLLAWKGLTPWLSCMWCFVAFLSLSLGWVWYLSVLIPDLCLLTYFKTKEAMCILKATDNGSHMI